ncbi:MAG: hypothetical protein SF051_15040 [Elusimicrobiota bacterium]|nr:hypothetical protein [Elusimicrobiota bacterium]
MKASAKVPKVLYARADLAAAALVLSGRGAVSLSSDGARWIVEVEGARAAALLDELLDEALSHAWRQSRVKAAGPAARALSSRLLAEGFPAAPEDPLEMLEPTVAADRREDAERLLERARRGD